MSTHNYAFEGYEKEKMAKVVGRDLPVSTKQSIEICTFIRGKSLEKAKEMLEEVLKMKRPVPFNRFTEGAGHKKGHIAGGRYPLKASAQILELLNSVEANAQQKGLNTSSLTIKHACANKASRPPRYGRMRGLQAKRTHVEIVAAESEGSDEKKGEHREKVQKAGQKTDAKAQPKAEHAHHEKIVSEKTGKTEKSEKPEKPAPKVKK